MPHVYGPRPLVFPKPGYRLGFTNDLSAQGHGLSFMKPYRANRRRFKPRRYMGLPRKVDAYDPAPELKYFDAPLQNVLIGVAGVINILAPSQGTGLNQINGTSINLRHIIGKFSISLPSTNAVNISWRVSIVYDRQPNGVAMPAYTDIYASGDTTSFLNLSNKDRFVVISNEEGSLSVSGTQVVFVDVFRKIDMRTTFPLDTTTPQPPITGSLYLCLTSDAPNNDARPIFSCTYRTRFVDA